MAAMTVKTMMGITVTKEASIWSPKWAGSNSGLFTVARSKTKPLANTVAMRAINQPPVIISSMRVPITMTAAGNSMERAT
jgi:hypothetical protein